MMSHNSSLSTSLDDDTDTIHKRLQMFFIENQLLREHLTELIDSMESVYETFSLSYEQLLNDRKDCFEKSKLAKQMILRLVEQIKDKDQFNESLIRQLSVHKDDDVMSLKQRLVALEHSLKLAIEEKNEWQNKYISLQVQPETSSIEHDRCSQQTIATLQQTNAHLKTLLAKEKNEKCEASDGLCHLRLKFDELLSEYEQLINDEKENRASMIAKENQIQFMEKSIEELKAQVQRNKNQAEYKSHESLYDNYLTLKKHFERLTAEKGNDQMTSIASSSSKLHRKKDGYVCPLCGFQTSDFKTLEIHCYNCVH